MDVNVADAIIKGLLAGIVFLAVVIILLITVILAMVVKHNTNKSLDRVEQAIRRQVAGAERRIERLMAEARAAMLDETYNKVQEGRR